MNKLFYTLCFFFCGHAFLFAQQPDALHYRFAIELNDRNDTLYGNTDITLVKKSGAPVYLDLRQPDKEGKGMKVYRVEKSGSTEAYPFTQKNNQLIIPVIEGRAGDTLQFRVVYKGIPDDGLIISRNKFGDRTFFADNWPNRAHHWLPCIDRPDDKASFEFLVTAPAHYSVISNGIKMEESSTGNLKRTHWKEEAPQPTKVMVIGAARFAVKQYTDSSAGVPVSAWVYPKDSTKGFYDYAITPGIVSFFSNYIGPFPYKKLANVQSTTMFGGMENASAIFYAETSVTGDRSKEDLMAHEIAHQWFGDAASEKSFAHLWLSEGFASYLTNLYFENKYGRKVMEERLKGERDEVRAFQKTSPLPVVDSTSDLMSLLNANSYQKGSWVLHMLRGEVGDSIFQKIIQTYYQQYKGRNAETADFRTVAETVSGKNLEIFFNQWLYKGGIPSIEVLWMPGQRKIRVRQKGAFLFKFPLDVSIATKENQRVTQTLLVQKKQEEFTIDFEPSDAPLLLDPATKLLFSGGTNFATEGAIPIK